MDRTSAVREIRLFGGVWIVLAPIGWIMAGISTVKDDDFYHLQLAVFTVGAVAAIVFGSGAVLRQA
jgi:hypothetical protein